MSKKQNHCHECEKANHWDIFFLIASVAITIFLTLVFGWEAWKYLIWPWIFLLVMYIGQYFKGKSEQSEQKNK